GPEACATSHTLIVLSLLPAASSRPSRLNASEVIVVSGVIRRLAARWGAPSDVLAFDQSRSVLSDPAAAVSPPSGLNASAWVIPVMPVNGAISIGCTRSEKSQRRTPAAVPAAARIRPSGLKASD